MSQAPDQRFDRLRRDHAPAVVRYARRHVLPAGVEDVVAETLVVPWRRVDEVPASGLPWLLGVARHVSADVRRGHRRRDALVAGREHEADTATVDTPARAEHPR